MAGSNLMLDDDEWERTKSLFPLGRIVEGQVAVAWDFMVFIALAGTEAPGVVVMTSLSDKPSPLTAEDFPHVGETVKAIVVGHRDNGRQISLSLRPSEILEGAR